MKSFILILFIFYSFSLYAQKYNGIINYKVQLSQDNELFKNKDQIYLNAFSASKDIEYVLFFNRVESYFFIERSLESTKVKNKLAAIFAGYVNPIYIYFSNNYYYYKPQENPFTEQNEFVIKSNSPTKWELENQTKKIGQFVCYKATLKIKTYKIQKTEDKNYEYFEQDQQVIAWYTPEIPIPTGPMGYGNLPGLILELRTDKAVFGATNINLNIKEPPQINVPKGNKEITYIDYIKLTHKRMQEVQDQN